MELEQRGLTQFEPELRRVADLAFGAAGRLFDARHLKPDGLPAAFEDGEFRAAFRRACHEAFEQAQQSVGESLAQLEEETRTLEAEIRRARKARGDTAAAEGRLETLRNRVLVFRRLMDTILCYLLQMKPWVARRLMSQRETQRLDPGVVREALKFAAARNAENRERFALVADLTTIVNVCDLVELEMVGETLETRLIELKGGEINLRLMEAMKDPDKSQFGALLRELGEKGVRQASRILKQAERLHEVRDILHTDAGTDPLTGFELMLHPEELEIEGYQAALGELMERARKNSWAMVTVDSSLRLVGVTTEALDREGDATVLHAVYHMGRPDRPCLLGDENRASAEMDAIGREPSPVDLVSFTMAARWARPVFLWELSPESIMDLVFGRIRIFAQFNVEAFRRLVHTAGFQTTWVSGREAAKLKQQRLSGRIPGAPPGAAALRVTGKRAQVYLSGFFWRVIGEMMRPKELLHAVVQDQNRADEAEPARSEDG